MSTPQIAAVILAAGFGTRLAPLTDTTPKPLLEVGGAPVVSHLLDRLREIENLTRVVVVANEHHPQQWSRWRSSLDDPAVTVVSNGVRTEAERLGAVADLNTGIAALTSTGHADIDHIVVLAGDNLIDEPLQPHVDAAQARRQPIVLCRDLGDTVPPGRFGEITVDSDNTITRFREKPAQPESPLAATCTYVLPGDINTDVAEYLHTGDADSPGSFIAWLARRRAVAARTLTGRYFDIGNHETLAAARKAYTSGY